MYSILIKKTKTANIFFKKMKNYKEEDFLSN